MNFEFIVRLNSATTEEHKGSVFMADWSREAARRFAEKQANEQRAQQIISAKAPHQFETLEHFFTEKIQDFNAASGNRIILNLYRDEKESFSQNTQETFRVTRVQTQKTLEASFNPSMYKIHLYGKGGLQFDETYEVKAELHTGSAYLVDKKNHPIDIENVVTDALNALLEIGNEV